MGFLRAATRCRAADRSILAFGQLRSDRTARHLRSAWRSHVTGSSESEVWKQVSSPTSVWRSIRTHAIRLVRVAGAQPVEQRSARPMGTGSEKLHVQASVNAPNLSSDIARGVCGQEMHDPRNLLRLGQPTHANGV